MNGLIEPLPLIAPPKTGQTVEYRAGDDGTYEAGHPRSTRLVDTGGGVILDHVTGLMWVKQPELIIPGAVGVHASNQVQVGRGDWANSTAYAKADCAKDVPGGTYWVCAVAHTSAAGPATFAEDRAANPTYWRQSVWTADAVDPLNNPQPMTWNDAIDNSLALEYAGFADWRLPNMMELLSLHSSQTVRGYPEFPNMWDWYWTATTRNDLATGARIIAFIDTGTLLTTADKATSARRVRPVRGGILNG